MVANVIQRNLEKIYGIALPVAVNDFVIDKRTLEQLIALKLIDASYIHRRGALLIYCEGEEINISLYLEQRLYEISEKGSFENVSLNDLCTVFEEISHFFHLISFWQSNRQTTQFELELLGEIDKFLLSFLTLVPIPSEEKLRQVYYRLFGRFIPVKGLDTQQWQRYYCSYRLAARYCSHLERKFLKPLKLDALTSELRHFRRLPCSEKMSFIARC